MLKVKGMKVQYDQQIIVQESDLVFPDGTLSAIIGESGSGKTSILRKLILEEIDPLVEIKYNDQILDESLKRDVLYYANQENSFIVDLSCLDHFYLIGKMMNKEITLDQIHQICKQVGLTIEKNTYPSQLSGGEKQRFAIALALMKDAPLLIFDEITSSLDEVQGQAIMDLLKSLISLGKTVIITSHNQQWYEQCDRIYAIEDHEVKLIKDCEKQIDRVKVNSTSKLNLLNSMKIYIKRIKKQSLIQNCFTLLISLMIAICGVGLFIGKQYSTLGDKQAEVFKQSPAFMYISPDNSGFYNSYGYGIDDETLDKIKNVNGVIAVDPTYRFGFNQKYFTSSLEEVERPNIHFEYSSNGTLSTKDIENVVSMAVYSYNENNQLDYYCKEVNTDIDGVYISSAFAWQLGVNSLKDIDTITIPVQVPIASVIGNYIGISKEIEVEKEVRGILRDDYPQFQGNFIYMNESEMVDLLDSVKGNNSYPDSYVAYQPNLYYIYLDSSIPFETIQKDLKQIDYEIQLNHMNQFMNQNLKPLVQNQKFTMVYVVGLVAVILIVSFVYSFFEFKEHQQVYLVTRNMGFTKQERNRLFIGEWLVNSMIYTLISGVLCMILIRVLNTKGVLYMNTYTSTLTYFALGLCLILSSGIAFVSHMTTWKKHV